MKVPTTDPMQAASIILFASDHHGSPTKMTSTIGLFTCMVGGRETLVNGLAAYSAQTAVPVNK